MGPAVIDGGEIDAPAPNMSVQPPGPMPAQGAAPAVIDGGEIDAPARVTIPGNRFDLHQVSGGGVIPEHEKDFRAPTLKRAQDVRNAMAGAAIDRVGGRNVDMAQQEYDLALDQERAARVRESAAQQSIAERDEELAQRQHDFDSTVKQLGKLGQIDRGRVYASMSTPQKISGFIELALSGFTKAPSMILKKIDDDVKAQEFAYTAMRDTAHAKQSAFSMAMQKYQNLDVARAAARAAMIDVTQAQFAQLSAKWKGTESANRADMAFAALGDERMQQIGQAMHLIPAQVRGRMWRDENGVLYDENQARAHAEKVRERNFLNNQEITKGGIQLSVADANNTAALAKEQASHSKDDRALMVQLPNGDVVRAPSAIQADKLREVARAKYSADRLVESALEIRKDPLWSAKPSKVLLLKQIGKNLVFAQKNKEGLGAISGSDMDLSEGSTGDPASMKFGTEEVLKSFQTSTDAGLHEFVKTFPDAAPSAKGQLEGEAAADFKPSKK